jgi:hypothetical protein
MLLLMTLILAVACRAQPPATLVLRNARVYTMEETQPWAAGVAITGNKITAVLRTDADVARYLGTKTQVIDLAGKFVVPGFIDGHTHLGTAGGFLIDANLLAVSDDAGLQSELRRVTAILEPGEWITGGMWGAYEQWAMGSATASAPKKTRWRPSRAAIDRLTPSHPVLLRSFDGALMLANAVALKLAGLESATGLFERGDAALKRLNAAVKPKSEERRMRELREALKRLSEAGIVEVHDIVQDDQVRRYLALEKSGELNVRVWLRADLSRAAEFEQKGLRLGAHPITNRPDARLRWGAFKGYIDGIMGNHTALFFDSYNDQPGNYGFFRHHTSDDPQPPYKNLNMEKIYDYLRIAQRAGFPANVHAIGDKGVSLMLDTYERLMKQSGRPLEGYRVIHCQVVRPRDFPRFRQLGVYAEVNPYHLSDDMRWMEERIGKDRSRGAYAFRSLLDHGASLVFASDWGGSFAADYQMHPKYLLHAAVNRTTLKHLPKGGWFPDQKLSMEQSLRAYTINGARAAFDGETRGSIKPGKLADLAVLDRNLLEVPAHQILETQVVMTIFDGVVQKRGQ